MKIGRRVQRDKHASRMREKMCERPPTKQPEWSIRNCEA
jgi:hypothetical protein